MLGIIVVTKLHLTLQRSKLYSFLFSTRVNVVDYTITRLTEDEKERDIEKE